MAPTAKTPGECVVLIGASDNDLGQDDAAVAKAMAAAVERLSDALPKAHLIGYNALTGEASDSDLAPLNDALKQAVTAAGGRWIDLGQPYRGQVGLVQDDGLGRGQVEVLLLGQVDEASGRADDDVHAALERLDLRLVGPTAVDGEHLDPQPLAGPLEVGGHLTG